jgi:preprotein translocase subunit YajC
MEEGMSEFGRGDKVSVVGTLDYIGDGFVVVEIGKSKLHLREDDLTLVQAAPRLKKGMKVTTPDGRNGKVSDVQSTFAWVEFPGESMLRGIDLFDLTPA